MRKLALFLLLSVSSLFAAAPEGIPRNLARQRAGQISDVRYHLQFTLTSHALIAAGHEEIQFRLKTAVPVLLDFREGGVTSVSVNKNSTDVHLVNGHLELPADLLHRPHRGVHPTRHQVERLPVQLVGAAYECSASQRA